MKKVFGVSVICAFIMLLSVTFSYAAWPPDADIVYGYAKLNDSTSYVFRSDGNANPYTDARNFDPIANGDKLELALNNNSLTGVLLYLGKPDRSSYPNSDGDPPYPPGYCSPRKANFWFDINNGVKTSNYKNYKAAFDILVWKNSSKTERRGNPVGGKYYLNDNSVCLGIRRWVDAEAGGIVHDLIFTIEPSTTPCTTSGPNAVTETAINSFYTNDKNYNYEDYLKLGTSIFDLVVYYIGFGSDFAFEQAGTNTWTVSGGGQATLGVVTVVKERTHQVSWIPLASYANLPFQAMVSTTGAFTAPPKSQSATTLWGEIKSKE